MDAIFCKSDGQAGGQADGQTDHADCRGELRKVQMCMHTLHVYHDPTQNKSLKAV